MEYQFDVRLQIVPDDRFETEGQAEKQADTVIDEVMYGSKLRENDYPDISYLVVNIGKRYALLLTIDFKIQVEAGSIQEAKNTIDTNVDELIIGSRLVNCGHRTVRLSDEQPGLDDLLTWIDPDFPFAVQEPGERYHYSCGIDMFGQKRVDRAENGKEDELIVIYGREWESEVRNAWVHAEEIVAYCGYCRGSLYDEPKKEEE